MKYTQSNKSSIQSLFNKISPNYDTINNLMSFGLHKRIKKKSIEYAVKKLGHETTKILDVCTGTGDIAIHCKELQPHAEVIGIDFSANMLEIAKENAHNNITFIEKDVTNIGNEAPLEKESFDLIFISFGLRNLPDIDNFMHTIKEYLKPNGIISILDVGKPHWYMRPYFALHYAFIIPLFAKILNKDDTPYKYLVTSAENYPSQEELCKKLLSHGYKAVESKDYSFGIIAQQLGQK